MLYFKGNLLSKGQLEGMSYENLMKVAEENPLIPNEALEDGMSAMKGHDVVIEDYCHLVLGQPDMVLDSIPNLIPTQSLARTNATYWLNNLHPKILKVYTNVKSFCFLYSAIDDEDIDYLTSDLNSPEGKEEFREVMGMFQDEVDHCIEEIEDLVADLNAYLFNFYEDIRNFQAIKIEADVKYSSMDGRIPQAQSTVELNLAIYNALLDAIGQAYAKLKKGVIALQFGVFVTIFSVGFGISLIIGAVIELITAAIAIGQLVKQSHVALDTYRLSVIDLNQLQAECTALQVLSDNFDSLIEGNSNATDSLKAINASWDTLGNNFTELAKSVEGIVDVNNALLIRIRLKAARSAVIDIKELAEFLESQGLLPVIPEENIGRIVRLPSSWIGAPIPSESFRAFLHPRERLSYYSALNHPNKKMFGLCSATWL